MQCFWGGALDLGGVIGGGLLLILRLLILLASSAGDSVYSVVGSMVLVVGWLAGMWGVVPLVSLIVFRTGAPGVCVFIWWGGSHGCCASLAY